LRRILLLITALWLQIPGSAWCYDVLIVQSQRSPAYDEVLRGLRFGTKFTERVIILTDYREADIVRIVREESPFVVVTLGDKALAAAHKVRQVPVVALMAVSFRPGQMGNPSITGVEIQSPPEKYLSIFAALKSRSVGVVSSAHTSSYLKKARKATVSQGLELVTKEVKSSQSVPSQVESLAGHVDTLWMVPDRTSGSGKAADSQLLFSVAHKAPVVTFSSAYLDAGAAVSLDFDRYEVGRQASEMVRAAIGGDSASDISSAVPRKTSINKNASVLRRLGIDWD
jgi:putative tryptophan/tyrosine transport system substrate-binding protein